MLPIIENKITPIKKICRQTGVESLHLFGSAAKGGFSAGESDLDFLVDFKEMPPISHAEAYFDLLEGLEGVFGCPVDLLEYNAIRNPYLKKELENSRQLLFHEN